MNDLIRWLFTSDGFMPHGHCYLWTAGIVRLHVISDALIALSYYSIPITLAWFVRKRRDVDFRWIFLCFAVFILACGTTHLLEIWNVWHSAYWLSGGMKAVTAAASVPTAYLLTRLLPQALALPSPSALQQANTSLRDEVAARRGAEEKLRDANAQLESRVAERTAELQAANAALQRQIFERERSDDQLRASLNEVNDLKTALDEHAIVAITDAQGRITFVNDKFCAISKYSREELLGQDHRIINSGYHPAEFIRDLWVTITHGKVWHGEIKNRAKDGSFYWVDTTIVPFLNEQGKPRQYVAIRADITARKRAEEALRESEEESRATFEQAAVGLAHVTPDGRFLKVNQRYADIVGRTREDTHTCTFQQITHPDDLDADLALCHRLLAGEITTYSIEKRYLHPDSSPVWVNLTVSLVREDTGAPKYLIAVVEEISGRKQVEAQVQQLNANLEQRVIERTAQLESANKELEAFSYSVSHDLRAPLRAIDGFSQAVLEDCGPQLPEEGQRYLNTIRQGAQRMGMLIDDLLTFSRLSRAPLNRKTVNTGHLVRSVVADLRSQMEGRQIDLRIGDLPDCSGDPALLKQVWVNLLSNAFKYTGKREAAVVEIGCEHSPEGDVYFVKDNGTGFDMRYAGKLFGVFQRLHRAEDYEGTGVGLALVQRVIHRHGGRVWADAAVDRGATFYFTLAGGANL